MKTNGCAVESCVTETPFCKRVPSEAARAPTEFSVRVEAYRRRTIWEPCSPALRRVSAFSRLSISVESPPPLTVLKASRKPRSEEHTSELQSLRHLVCRLLLE